MSIALDFTGKVVAITGGSKGVGRGIVERFLEAGATVEYCARTAPDAPGDRRRVRAPRRAQWVLDALLPHISGLPHIRRAPSRWSTHSSRGGCRDFAARWRIARRYRAGMRVTIRVRPGSARPGVGGAHDGALVVRVSARAVDGKATAAALAAIAAAAGLRASEVRLVSGATSRTKIVELPDAAGATLAALLRGDRNGPGAPAAG